MLFFPSPPVGEGGSPRSGETGEGSLSTRKARRETPHPNELVSACGAALSHKGRGHINAHRKMQSTSVRLASKTDACSDASSRLVVTRCSRG
ncbi:hypothetical protein F8237_26785 [Bradyrhizobium betae]|uniref:Uncharacterized protein n=1 Tax=Bradyrhizobium betae TaxID=244734 RepID=A0A5P6PBR7_9BRAD|nr:hypothetical protein F8237_26785 [Bradyrhizobium betae]